MIFLSKGCCYRVIYGMFPDAIFNGDWVIDGKCMVNMTMKHDCDKLTWNIMIYRENIMKKNYII